MENCGLKCSYCFELSHIDERCWKKNKRSFPTTANYLEVLVNDEEATLTELNRLCGMKNNVFLKTRVSSC
jgi:sulfatase maturation enzyme AslB (radical SAM superfamily)